MTEGDLLVPLDKYLSAGMHIGMKQRTEDMSRFIYKVRPDGLAVLNIRETDRRLKQVANMIAQHDNVLVVSRKGIGRKPVRMFGEATGYDAVPGRLIPGSLTNPDYRFFKEPDLVVISDPIADAQALREAVSMRIPVIALCDTYNETRNVDYVLPINNKGRKSMALAFWILAREVNKIREGIKDAEFKYDVNDFLAKKKQKKQIDRYEMLAPRSKKKKGKKK